MNAVTGDLRRAEGLLPALSPAQVRTYRALRAMLRPGASVSLTQGAHNFDRGLGATTILRAMQRETGGAYVDIASVYDLARLRHPRQFEQSTFAAIRRAAENADFLYLDHPPYGPRQTYNRYGMIHAILRDVGEFVAAQGKQAVFVGEGVAGAVRVNLPGFAPDDYAHVFAACLGVAGAHAIDMAQVHDHAAHLSARHIVRLCAALRAAGIAHPTTRDVIEQSSSMSGANIDLGEVEAVDMASLKGFEPIFRRLDRSVLLPLRDPVLARRMGLRAARGVLLHGPPGTGKTSIGRALAHQMRGRFFMINGDYNHDQRGGFYDATAMVFDMAVQMAPSVLFIDDADVILADPDMQHWARFLLTKLDGLHSRGAAQVCVMMTAMNVRDLPPALLRSGRLDLWLETHLPDGTTRAAILAGHLAKLPIDTELDPELVAALTDGFTPADLRGVAGDFAGFIALDRMRGTAPRPLADQLRRSVAQKAAQKRVAAQLPLGHST